MEMINHIKFTWLKKWVSFSDTNYILATNAIPDTECVLDKRYKLLLSLFKIKQNSQEKELLLVNKCNVYRESLQNVICSTDKMQVCETRNMQSRGFLI